MIFVIRVTRDETGVTGGTVERLRTGEKAALRGLEALGGVIARMIEAHREGAQPDAGSGAE
jgi:hypothetical protein